MTKPEEEGEKATGCYTLQCSECAFKETIWAVRMKVRQMQKHLTHVQLTVNALNIKKY